jgi:hypothetical protein
MGRFGGINAKMKNGTGRDLGWAIWISSRKVALSAALHMGLRDLESGGGHLFGFFLRSWETFCGL